MKIRQHRGQLADSMATVAEISATKIAVADHVSKHWGYDHVDAGRVEVKPYGFDGRIGWDTHIVLIDGIPFGFTDGPPTDISNT